MAPRPGPSLPGATFTEGGHGGAIWVGRRDNIGNYFADCVMDHNTASLQGSALYVGTEGSSTPITPIQLHSSTLAHNRVVGSTNQTPTNGVYPNGYAVYYDAPAPTTTFLGSELIRNTILWGNRDANNAALQIGPPGVVQSTVLAMEYSDVEIPGGAALTGPGNSNNINADPLFASATYFLIDSTSPCRNAGTGQSLLPPDFPDLDDSPATTVLPTDWRVRSQVTGVVFDRIASGSTQTDMGALEVQ